MATIYNVEGKTGIGWLIADVFRTRAEANTFARNYAIANRLTTRIVPCTLSREDAEAELAEAEEDRYRAWEAQQEYEAEFAMETWKERRDDYLETMYGGPIDPW